MATKPHAFSIRLSGEPLRLARDDELTAKIESVWGMAKTRQGFKHARLPRTAIIKEAIWRGLLEMEEMYQ